MKVVNMCIRMIRRLFGKRSKVYHLPKEKVKESGTNDVKMENENKEQEHLQADMTDSHEILLSPDMIFKKHAECPFTPSSSSFSSFRIRLPPMKNRQHSSVDSSLHPDDAKSSQFPKLAWEETLLTGTEINETELQTVDESTEQETKSLVIENVQNESLDGKICRLETEFHAEMDKWVKFEQEEKLKLKLEMVEAKQRRQMETKELKLKQKFLEKEAKHEKKERNQKLKDLEKEIKNEKAMLLLKLKEQKKKVKMEKKKECNEDKMEQHRKDDEKVNDAQNKNVLKIFRKIGFRSCKAV